MAATHNVCGSTIFRFWFNQPGGTPAGYILVCGQCNAVVTVGEISGAPTDDAVSSVVGT